MGRLLFFVTPPATWATAWRSCSCLDIRICQNTPMDSCSMPTGVLASPLWLLLALLLVFCCFSWVVTSPRCFGFKPQKFGHRPGPLTALRLRGPRNVKHSSHPTQHEAHRLLWTYRMLVRYRVLPSAESSQFRVAVSSPQQRIEGVPQFPEAVPWV